MKVLGGKGTATMKAVRPRGGVKVASYANSQKLPAVSDVTKRIREFPGEDAPGTGQRHFPNLFDMEARVSGQKHAMKTTAECYRDFAALGQSPQSMAITSKVPSGRDAMMTPDSGPETGNRRKPLPFDAPPKHLVDPVDPKTPEARLHELKIRRSC